MLNFALWFGLACTSTEKTNTDLDGQVVSSDQDGDGFVGEEDCNDFEATINPGAEELCDNLDNNCNLTNPRKVPSTCFNLRHSLVLANQIRE